MKNIHTNIPLRILQDNISESTYTTTKINDILQLHSFYNQLNVLESIIQHNSFSDNLKLLGEYLSKSCYIKMKSFDHMEKLYRAYGLAHDKQQYKHIV